MSDLPQPGTQFWYLSALNTKIVVLYLGKIPRRKHNMLLDFENGGMRSVVWLTDEQLAAQLTQVVAGDDPDRLSDTAVEAALAAFRRSKSTSALVDNLRALCRPRSGEAETKGEQETHDDRRRKSNHAYSGGNRTS